MKMKRISVLLAACICSATLLTGCSFSDVTGKVSEVTGRIFGKTQEITSVEDNQEKAEKSGLSVDSSVEKPEFTSNLGGRTQLTMGAGFGLTAHAEVSKGTVTYQWYTNNVNSNGGGTPIVGETNDYIYVDTSAKSHKFYYVVATNEVDGKINRTTSMTQEIVVWDIGTWQEDEYGCVRYMMIDGTYPKNTWFLCEDYFCYVDENGVRASGLYTLGDVTYYFSEDGKLQRDTVGPNGEPVDGNGIVGPVPEAAVEGGNTEEVTGESEENTEAPVEEQPAEE